MVLLNYLMYLKSDFLRHFSRKTRIIPQILHQTKAFSSQPTNKSKENENCFDNSLQNVINCVVKHPRVSEIYSLEEWLKKLFTHNMTGGKYARGKSVGMVYGILERPENITTESMEHANVLGCCLEMAQAFLLIQDDIVDGSVMRRGKPCWYTLPEVGSSFAINDAITLYLSMFYVLKQYFGEKKYYKDLLDTFNEAMLFTTFGQYLDLKSDRKRTTDFSLFTSEIYLSLIKFKTAFYTYDLPTKLGLILANYSVSNDTKELIQDISLEIGTLFQIQDDYLDCFGDKKLTGKENQCSDIQEGKCTWLAVTALQRCTPAQRVVFKACYGSNEPAHIERCQQIYCKLNLPELYKAEEEKYYSSAMRKINKLPTIGLQKVFQTLLDVTYKRQK